MHERQMYVTGPVDKDQEDHIARLTPENATAGEWECDVGKSLSGA
jgi:hypothetical protein